MTEAISQKRFDNLIVMMEKLQRVIEEITNDDTTCLPCRSAALGRLVIQLQKENISPLYILDRSTDPSPSSLCEILWNFEDFKLAACRTVYKPHFKLGPRLYDIANSILSIEGLDLCQN